MPKILVLEDQSSERYAVSRLLRCFGHSVMEAQNGREGLAQSLADVPDLILTDVHMPEMDGASFLETLRTYARLSSVPVIVLTGLDDGPLIDRIRAQNVNAILVKGEATPDDIEATVSLALAKAEG